MMYSSLYIIGNGFDRAHGMPTGYGHFKRWLIESNRYDVTQELQSAYPIKKDDEYLLWSEFEKSLGEYDIDTVINWSWENIFLTVAPLGNMVFNKGRIDTQLPDIIEKVFTKWVQSIQISDTQVFDLKWDSLFFTFNYTDILEQLYQIPEHQVFHIHGNASKGDKLIVGHNREIDVGAYYDENLCVRENNERVQRLADMNSLRKPYQELIEQNETFFNSLGSVEEVFVIGHSCAPVDYPYFHKIRDFVARDAKWHINTHSEEDIIRRDAIKKELGIL